MTETDNTDNSGISDTTTPEQKNEEEIGEKPSTEDGVTDVIDSEDGESKDEPKVSEPSEEDENADDTVTADSTEINAAGDSYTVTIADYADLKDKVTFTATVGGQAAKISSDGKITAKEGENNAKPAIALTIAAKAGYQITSVKKGDADVTGSEGTYTISDLTADTTITVTTEAVYTLNVAVGDYGISVKTGTNEDGSDKTEAVAAGANKTFARGALEFTVTGYTATANDRLKVYYVADGSTDDDANEITGETTGEGVAAKTTYSVAESVINSLDGSIKIILKKEEKKTVAITANDKVDVQYWGKKKDNAPADVPAGAWVIESGDGANITNYDKITTAFVGDTFKFKAVGKGNHTISKVKIGETEIDLQTTGEYEVTVTEEMLAETDPDAISFETVLDSAKSRTLTFTLTGDEDSATAKITSVTPAAEGDTTATATTADADMAAALGITAAELTLEPGEALSVLSAPTEIKVTITPAANYELAVGSDETLEADGTLIKTYTGASLAAAITIAATTQDKALAGTDSKYFKPSIASGSTNLSGLTIVANDKVVAVTGDDNAGVYEVKPGARNVAFQVTAKKGYKVADITGTKITAGTPAANGDVVYTIAVPIAKITGNAANAATAIEATEAAIVLNAEVNAAEGSNVAEYTAAMEVKGTADDAEYEDYTSGNNIAFGSAFRATITPKSGCRLDEVSYVMGTAAAVTVPVTLNDEDEPEAKIEIAEMTGNVVITVKSGKDYELITLLEAGQDSNTPLTPDGDGIYSVKYGKKYLVGVTQGGVAVPAKNISVKVKDATGAAVAMSNPIVSTNYRAINLATKKLAGQEITAEVFVKGVETAVGTYIMSVEKKTTAISVNGGNAIEQSVDSVASYDITTDGDLENLEVEQSGDITGFFTAELEGSKLVVKANPAKRSEVATSTTTGTAPDTTTTWTPKKGTITVKAKDVDDVEVPVEITLTPLFDEDVAPEVSLVDAADTVLNVKVSMADVAVPTAGSVWYKVTATAKANTPAQGETPASNRPDNMKAAVTEIVERTGSSNRVALQVGNSANLGEGAAWSYDVTAQLFYMEDEDEPASTVAAADAVAVSKEGKLEGAETKTPLFENALKLKKAKGAPAKLYTGQSGEIVIAEPQWTKKFTSYKILKGSITDSASGLTFDVNADGKIVVTNVAAKATLGKHTIRVTAAADETTGHTMYASSATINVTVAKGINKMLVTQPGDSIYKAKNRTGSLKLGVDYNHDYVGQRDDEYGANYVSWNGKKYVAAPAAKKVKWSIVDANSTEGNIIAAPAYLNVDTSGKGKTAANGVGVKNGTVTVGKNFAIDERHANNNRFKVLVEANDFAGNTTKALSEVITITKDALDISTLVIVNTQSGKEVVTAVHDIKDKKAVTVLADDVQYGRIYALPADAGVSVGTVWTSRLERTAAPLDNLTMTTTNKKVLGIGGYVSDYDEENDETYSVWVANQVNVLAAGKKAGIKVVTNDGGKKTHTMNMTLDYKKTEGSDLALSIAYGKADNRFYTETTSLFDPATKAAEASKANVKETPVTREFNVTGAARLYVNLYVGNKNDGTSTSYTRPGDTWAANYKLTVKGGKAVSNANGSAVIVTTAKETTLTLTDQTKEAKAAKKKPFVYKITNNAYDNTKVAKAPKVTVKGSLHYYAKAGEQNEALKLTVLDAANKNAPFAPTDVVKVEMDWSARNDKNSGAMNTFANALNLSNTGKNTTVLGASGTISLFGGDAASTWKYLPVGSYKLKVTVGSLSGANFTAKTLPATVTVKVVKAKTFTFKPTTSYTINKVDGGAVLTGKTNLNAKAGEKLGIYFSTPQNANVNGKSNNFTHYFKIAEDEKTHTQRLTLNTDDALVKAMLFEKKADGSIDETKPIKDPKIEIPKADLTGYISYWAQPSVNYYTNSNYGVSGTVKITVKIAPEVKPGKAVKPSQKYVTNRAEVALTANAATEMNVLVNGAYVSVAYAMVDESKRGNAEELKVDLAGNAKGQIVLKTALAVEEGKTYQTNLLIVPTASFYKGLIDGAAAAAARDGEAAVAETKQDLIKKYGIAIKVSVLASKNPAKTPDPTAVGGDEPDTPEMITVTVSSDHANVKYAVAAADSNAVPTTFTAVTNNTISVEQGKKLYLEVTAADGYTVSAVKKGSDTLSVVEGQTNVYLVGAITEAVTVTVEATQNQGGSGDDTNT